MPALPRALRARIGRQLLESAHRCQARCHGPRLGRALPVSRQLGAASYLVGRRLPCCLPGARNSAPALASKPVAPLLPRNSPKADCSAWRADDHSALLLAGGGDIRKRDDTHSGCHRRKRSAVRSTYWAETPFPFLSPGQSGFLRMLRARNRAPRALRMVLWVKRSSLAGGWMPEVCRWLINA